MRRSSVVASLTLAAYAVSVLLLPVLHRLHHERYGADHVHTEAGAIRLGAGAPPGARDEAAHHAAFDADLSALGLGDVARAGVLFVDCSVAAYTLASCPAALGSHPHTFGDELLARAHSHEGPAPYDLDHGRGAPEHLSAQLLAGRVFILTPPAQPAARTALIVRSAACPPAQVVPPTSRGPPQRS